MSVALNKIFYEIAEYSKTMGDLHKTFLHFVLTDTDRFLEMTKDLSNQMNWHARTVMGLTVLSTGFGTVGKVLPSMIPAATTNPPIPDLRLGATDGITDWFSTAMKAIREKCSDKNFLSTACTTTETFCNGIRPATEVWSSSIRTHIEARRNLIESINLKNDQTNTTMFGNQVQQAHQAAQRILECKSRGGV